MCNSIETLEGIITEVEGELLSAKRYKLYSENWTKDLPPLGGVYIIRNDEQVVYVGETANIKDRMHKDMKNTQNHTIRRNIGKYHFSDQTDYYPASSKKKFASSIEVLVDQHCKNNLTVSAAVVYVGRLEVEEYLIIKFEPIYNSKSNGRSLK